MKNINNITITKIIEFIVEDSVITGVVDNKNVFIILLLYLDTR